MRSDHNRLQIKFDELKARYDRVRLANHRLEREMRSMTDCTSENYRLTAQVAKLKKAAQNKKAAQSKKAAQPKQSDDDDEEDEEVEVYECKGFCAQIGQKALRCSNPGCRRA